MKEDIFISLSGEVLTEERSHKVKIDDMYNFKQINHQPAL